MNQTPHTFISNQQFSQLKRDMVSELGKTTYDELFINFFNEFETNDPMRQVENIQHQKTIDKTFDAINNTKSGKQLINIGLYYYNGRVESEGSPHLMVNKPTDYFDKLIMLRIIILNAIDDTKHIDEQIEETFVHDTSWGKLNPKYRQLRRDVINDLIIERAKNNELFNLNLQFYLGNLNDDDFDLDFINAEIFSNRFYADDARNFFYKCFIGGGFLVEEYLKQNNDENNDKNFEDAISDIIKTQIYLDKLNVIDHDLKIKFFEKGTNKKIYEIRDTAFIDWFYRVSNIKYNSLNHRQSITSDQNDNLLQDLQKLEIINSNDDINLVDLKNKSKLDIACIYLHYNNKTDNIYKTQYPLDNNMSNDYTKILEILFYFCHGINGNYELNDIENFDKYEFEISI